MKDAKREILLKVSRGQLTPEAAAAELEQIESPEPEPEPEHTASRSATDLERVRIVARMGSVKVYGDSTVREAVAEGPHRAHREGGTLVIEAGDETADGFTFGRGRVRFGIDEERRLQVRMNPALRLDAELSAGSLRIEGIGGPIRAEIQAGSARIDGFNAPLELDVRAGSVNAWGRLDEGASRVRCQAGSVNINLRHGSSVRVRARTSHGRVRLPDGRSSVGIGGGRQEAVVGSGRGTLDIESEMGSVNVRED